MTDMREGQPQPEFAKDEVLAALQRVVQSTVFSQSTSLRDTLEFIVRNSFSFPTQPIKEYSIATEVLGRPGDFNPKVDTIVRVQMRRLRDKLDEYYSTEGSQDEIRIVVPRKHYTPQFVRNQPQALAPSAERSGLARFLGKWGAGLWGGVLTLAVCGLALAVVPMWRRHHKPSLPSSLAYLWQPFLTSSSPPLIVYSNAAFLANSQGVFYFRNRPADLSLSLGSKVPALGNQDARAGEEVKGPFYYFDSYTGTGELVAAAGIAEFLTSHHQPFLIRRSRIVSYEDIKNQNVIFLGGTGQDLVLKNLPLPLELVFVLGSPSWSPLGAYVQDLNPRPGYPSAYHIELDRSTGAIQTEYALISLVPGVSETHAMLILAGISSLGTQAAAEFALSESNMASLDQMRKPVRGQKSPYFQALLQVQVRDGVALDAKCLMVRDLNRSVH